MGKRLQISNEGFIQWHCHSEYSAFDGQAKLRELVMLARKFGNPALALTDHGVISGWPKFLAECVATKDKDGNAIPYAPIKPILGCEFYLCRKHDWKSKEEYETKVKEAKKAGMKLSEYEAGYQKDGRKGNRHLNLYAMNWKGYQNLCTLSEKAWVDGYSHKDPRIDLLQLAEHSEGIMVGTACLSSAVNANLLNDRYDKAKHLLGMLKDITKGNVFLEGMYNGISDQRAILGDIFKLSREVEVPILATNDVHYLYKPQAKTQEVLMCISTKNCLTNPKHMHHAYDEFYYKSAEEMAKIWGHVPQTLFNTVAMAERIDTDDITSHLYGGMRLPKFELPPEFNDPFKYMVHLAKEGMRRLGWDKSPKHIEALKKELKDIQVAKESNNYDFSTYFLIVWDYINYARSQGIVTGCGRGSGYASVLLRCLGITYGPDPLQYDLLWERFLGFDDKRFIREADFGYKPIGAALPLALEEEEEDDLDEAREVEEDFGGTDRY